MHLENLPGLPAERVSRENPPALALPGCSPTEFLSHLAATLAAGTVELPAFPEVAIKVQEAFKDPSYTPQRVARVMSGDRALADRVLQMANSTAFNATGRVIIDLGVAITRLGAQKVHSVALAHAIQHIRQSECLRGIARPLDELWSESVTVAHFAEALAKRTLFSPQDAFVAGLLHDVGRLYILVQCGRQGALRPAMVLSDALVDAWHPAIAKAVLENWRIAEAVCEAVGAQAEVHVGQRTAPTLADVLVVGMRMAKHLNSSHDGTSLTAGGALARLNLSVEACHALVADAAADVRALQRALRA